MPIKSKLNILLPKYLAVRCCLGLSLKALPIWPVLIYWMLTVPTYCQSFWVFWNSLTQCRYLCKISAKNDHRIRKRLKRCLFFMPVMGSRKLLAWSKSAKVGNIGLVKVNQKMSVFRAWNSGFETQKISLVWTPQKVCIKILVWVLLTILWLLIGKDRAQ